MGHMEKQLLSVNSQKKYLALKDPILGEIIQKIDLLDHVTPTNYFRSLIENIISQQLSTKAANTIAVRFIALFNDEDFPKPQDVLEMPDEKIRKAGISYQKIKYIKDLAQKISEKLLDLNNLANLSDQEVIFHLTQVKGIGKWTAEMFLMFALNRPDVFSYGDLGLKNAMRRLYGLRSLPSEKKAQIISNKWQPFRTLACRYLWKSLEL